MRLWPVAGGAPRVLQGHTQNVNGIAFSADGRALVTASYDLTVRVWPLDGGAPTIVTLPAPLNALRVAPDGEIAAAGADGKVYFLTKDGKPNGDVALGPMPLVSLALSSDGATIAAADIRGAVTIIERKTRNLTRRLVGADRPVWSIAFLPDNVTLLTGGTDAPDPALERCDRRADRPDGPGRARTIRSPPMPAIGARRSIAPASPATRSRRIRATGPVPRWPACSDGGSRRSPGYNFSEPLKKLDIVWTPETVAKLFEIGPAAYTPGTKMPEQVIASEDDRKALVHFLARATKN